ncbi:hypothetical protein HPB49_009774 [Dermacentor silvarum]|uniref:Uncharacterized protein n=1 Tax=Dermacentor silvarum TaxID=543639 RepID=A0ACB8D4B2_DERSI|nr:hypothetical protein HPB49_009774 [Dermacentor silvarum]
MAGTIQDAVSKAGARLLLVLGDFNAPHMTWGYRFCSKRGRELAHLIEQHNLTLLNEPDTPTRMGTSTTRHHAGPLAPDGDSGCLMAKRGNESGVGPRRNQNHNQRSHPQGEDGHGEDYQLG